MSNSHWDRIIMMVLLAISLSGNVYLHHKYSDAVSISRSEMRGKKVSRVLLYDSNGKSLLLSEYSKGRPVVLYFYSKNCHWCKENEVAAESLRASLNEAYKVIAVTPLNMLDNSANTGERTSFSVYGLSDSDINYLGLAYMPETMVISGGGDIERVWAGPYKGQVRKDIDSYFNVAISDSSSDSAGTCSSCVVTRATAAGRK